MKKILIISLLVGGVLIVACRNDRTEKEEDALTENHDNGPMISHMQSVQDSRISLNLPPHKAQHQLMNMRSHLQAVQSIIHYLSKNEFDSASAVASSKLGLTEEMKMMCSSFGNEEFERLGLEFHKSADRMSEIMKTKDKKKSLESLSVTLNYCVSCHSTFKQ